MTQDNNCRAILRIPLSCILMKIQSVAVFCGSRDVKNPLYAKHAGELGKLIAVLDLKLVYGGGKKGLMGVLAESVLAHKGKAMGVIPMVTWNQLKIYDKKIYVLNSGGFYNHLHNHLKMLEQEGFLYEPLNGRIVFCDNPVELFNRIE